MLGFVIGTLCLFGLIRVLRRGYGWHGYHHGFHGFHGHHRFARFGAFDGGWGHRGRHMRGRGGLKWLFWRLDATHGQEKVIIHEWETLRDTLQDVRGDMRQSRATAAALLRSEHLDGAALEDVWRQHDAVLGKVREKLSGAVGRIHEALDEQQRRQLAEWLEQGI